MPPFDGVWIDALSADLTAPVEAYQSLLRDYPLLCPARPLRLDGTGIVLEDTLTDLRQNAQGQCIRAHLQASGLHVGDDLKWYHLTRHWPLHLAAQLGGAVTTRLLGPDTDLTLSPLSAETARTLLLELLDAYLQGLTALPPLACRTGFAALQARADGKGHPAVVYDGGYNRAGEREEHPGYRRFWPSYADLSADARFEPLIDRLYWPLFCHCRNQEGL